MVEEHQLKVVEALFKQHKIRLDQRSKAHDFYLTDKGLIIEIHPRLYNDFNPKYKPLFDSVWIDAKHLYGSRYELEHTFELLYLMNHLAKHLASSGIGLRSLLDISIYLNHFESIIDRSKLKRYLEQTSMSTYFNTILYLNHVYFGYKHNLLDQSFTLDELQLDAVTTYIMTSGIHGKGENFNAMAPRLVKSKSKTRLLLRILFPKYVDMKAMYPIVGKCFLLYPFFVGIRLFKLLFIKRRSSFQKMKDLQIEKDKLEKIKFVHKTLDL